MASTLRRPDCLHVPALYEESTATLNWETVDEAAGYELDQVFDETFEQAGKGKAWADLTADWTKIDDAMSWAEIHELPAQGYTWGAINSAEHTWEGVETADYSWKAFSKLPDNRRIFKGPGRPHPAPDQGLSWADVELETNVWSDVGDITWLDLSLTPSRGLTWAQLNGEEQSWEGVADSGCAWEDLARIPARGLNWDSINSRWNTWADVAEADRTWHSLERDFVDNRTHAAADVDIHLYRKRSQYRVRAFDSAERSDYLPTSLLTHLPRSLAKYKPHCIHIPALREGRKADIVWGGLYGAQGFVLERSFGGDFVELYRGEGIPVADPNNKAGCEILSAVRDVNTHFHFVDTLPYYEKTVQYRVKAFNTTDESMWQESAVVVIEPVFRREDSRTVAVSAGELVIGQVNSREIADFEGVAVTMTYPADRLEKRGNDIRALFGIALTEVGSAGTVTRVVEDSAGHLAFVSANGSGMMWSGLVIAPVFAARSAGNASMTLN